MRRRSVVMLAALCAAAVSVSFTPASAQVTKPAPPAGAQKPAPKPAPLFTTPLTPQELAGKQAVVETTAGRIVIDLLADEAPNHVGYFIKLAQEGAYDGTTFHRADQARHHPGRRSAVEGPGARRAQYGTGGLEDAQRSSPERGSARRAARCRPCSCRATATAPARSSSSA